MLEEEFNQLHEELDERVLREVNGLDSMVGKVVDEFLEVRRLLDWQPPEYEQ